MQQVCLGAQWAQYFHVARKQGERLVSVLTHVVESGLRITQVLVFAHQEAVRVVQATFVCKDFRKNNKLFLAFSPSSARNMPTSQSEEQKRKRPCLTPFLYCNQSRIGSAVNRCIT